MPYRPDSAYDALRERTYPAPYPTGWYHLLDAKELKPGEVRGVEALGKHLAVFRSETAGRVSVIDAHCPHLGASLARGDVRGDCIRCPFHHWSFNGDGELADVPGLTRLPRARVATYPVREHHGMIWMFHHVSGKPADPHYEPEAVRGIDDGRLRFRGRREVRGVDMHLSEFLENAVDFQHFAVVHNRLTIPWTQIALPGLGVEHDATWQLDPSRPHVGILKDQALVSVFGRHQRWTEASAEVTFFGPGGVAWFRFNIPELGDIVIFQTHLPLEPMRQRVRFRWRADPKIPRAVVWYVVGSWFSQWQGDVELWKDKIRRERPVLVSLDGPVHQLRRFASQFYETKEPDGAHAQ